MNKTLLTVASVALGATAAHAGFVIDDFSVGTTDYVIPTMPDYGRHDSDLGTNFLTNRGIGAASVYSHEPQPGETFTARAAGDGKAVGFGTAAGLLNLRYYDSAGTDFSGITGFTFDVKTTGGPVQAGWGTFSSGWSYQAGQGFEILAPTTTTVHFDLSQLSGSLVKSNVNSLYFDFQVNAGQTIELSNFRAESTPEPITSTLLAGGVALLVRRKRRAQL